MAVPEKDIKARMFPLVPHSSVKHSRHFLSIWGLTATYCILSMTMRTVFCIAALAGVAYSTPQLMDLNAIATDFAPPVLVEAPVNVVSNIPASSTAPEILPLQTDSAKKRNLEVAKRDGDCSPYPTGSGPVPTPDTPAAFQSDPDFAVRLCYRVEIAEQRF